MKKKPTILTSDFPTVEEVARLLGVSKRRAEQIVHLLSIGAKNAKKHPKS